MSDDIKLLDYDTLHQIYVKSDPGRTPPGANTVVAIQRAAVLADREARPRLACVGHFINTAPDGKPEHWETVSPDHAWDDDDDVVALYRKADAERAKETT